ncbi:MAG: efflux RND transporter periplasmic adaptor subunit [Novipirellula sp. JB048]
MTSEPQDKPAKKNNPTASWWLFNLVVPLALVVAAAIAVKLFGTVEPAQRPAADASLAGRMKMLAPVRAEQIKSMSDFNQALQLQVDGTVVPYREVRIATEVAGRIVFKAENCEAGSFVNQGDLLMRIDPTDYELEVARLTRLKEQEYEALGEVDQEMANTQRLIAIAEQDETLQQREVDRLQKLPEGFASEGEIDRARRAALQSTQQRINYENQLELLRKRRARLEASERLAAAQLNTANVNLQRTEIRAPIDGVIVNEDAELNTFVARGNTIVTLEDTTKVEVATSLRMDQLYWVLDQAEHSPTVPETGSRGYELPETAAIVEFEISGREGDVYRWDGRLLSYDGIGLDPTTRTVPVRILVDDPKAFRTRGGSPSVSGPSTLVRGMYVTVKLLIEPQTPLVVIPAAAMKPGNRAWEFVPDESVLYPPAAVATASPHPAAEADRLPTTFVSQVHIAEGDAVQTLPDPEPTSESPTSESPTSGEPARDFDPTLWRAGRIVNRTSILPVESLSLESPLAASEQDGPLQNGDPKWWVCEVQDQTMKPGAYVVVSPLGVVDGDTMPARMRVPEAAQPPQATDPQATDPQRDAPQEPRQ